MTKRLEGKAKVLADVERYVTQPDALMVSHGVASNQLSATDNMNISPSKMYEDGGHKMRVVKYLAARGSMAKCPRTREGMFEQIEAFLTFCGDNKVPPTLGGFAIWNGVTITRLDQIARDKTKPDLAEAASVAKEIIRNFLEISAMDSSLNPIIYFHQNKVYYGAVENAQVTVRIEDNATEISPEEYAERVGLITLTQGTDGTFRGDEV